MNKQNTKQAAHDRLLLQGQPCKHCTLYNHHLNAYSIDPPLGASSQFSFSLGLSVYDEYILYWVGVEVGVFRAVATAW